MQAAKSFADKRAYELRLARLTVMQQIARECKVVFTGVVLEPGRGPLLAQACAHTLLLPHTRLDTHTYIM